MHLKRISLSVNHLLLIALLAACAHSPASAPPTRTAAVAENTATPTRSKPAPATATPTITPTPTPSVPTLTPTATLGPLEVTTLRAVASLPFVLLSVAARGRLRDLRMRRPGPHVVRGLLAVAMITTFSYAARRMSLSGVYTLFMIAPLLVTAVSVPFLGERVRPGAWVAILVGLTGTLIVLRPSTQGLNLGGALAALGSAGCYAGSYVLARKMSRTESADSLVFWVLAMMAALSAILGIPQWQPVEPSLWRWVAVIGVTGAAGQLCITRAFLLAPASVIAPFEYTALVWGALFDWAIWSTHPTPSMLLGATLIVGCGVYVMLSNRQGGGALSRVPPEPHP